MIRYIIQSYFKLEKLGGCGGGGGDFFVVLVFFTSQKLYSFLLSEINDINQT